MDIQTLAYLKSYVNKVVGVTDAFRYKGETYIRDVSLNYRTNWNDLAPCSIGDTYILTDSNDKESVIINDKKYVVGDMIFTTNNVTVSEGQVSENVEVQVIGTRNYIDNDSILSDNRYGLKTCIGGAKHVYTNSFKTFHMNNLTTDSSGALDYYWEDIILDKNEINALISNNWCDPKKHVVFSIADSQGNTLKIDPLKFTIYTNTIESETDSNFWIAGRSEYGGDNYLEVVYFSDNYIGHLNISYEAGLKPLTTYNLTVTVYDVNYYYLDERFINFDDITITNKVDKSIEKIRAKSAIETKKLSDIIYPLTETIYRLTAQERISGVTYNPGIYVYDESGASPVWVGVGGTNSGVSDVKIDGTSIVASGVANIPTANQNNAGVVKVIGGTYGIEYDGGLKVINPTTAEINSRASGRKAINPAMLDYAVKAAMCDGVGAAWSTTEQLAARNRMNAAAKEYEILASHTVVEGEEHAFTINLPADTINNHICIFMYNPNCVIAGTSTGGYYFNTTTNIGSTTFYLNSVVGTDRKMIYTYIDKIDLINNIWMCSSHGQNNSYGPTQEVCAYRIINGDTIRSITFVAADPNAYNVGTQIYIYKTK